MTAPALAVERPRWRLTPQTLGMLGLALVAWAGVIAYARHMGNASGTMGIGFGEFVGMWSLMMTAMMLPAVAPVASLYGRTITTSRAPRLALFVSGYLVVWAAVGVPAFAALRLVDHLSASAVRTVGVVVLAGAGAYQLSPVKAVCLRHCRSPLAQLLRYGSVRGRTRDLKVALHHAGFCLGCCWALMALLVAFGIMNVWAMVGLTALVIVEKLSRYGQPVGRVAGIVLLALAAGVAASPRVSGALLPRTSTAAQMTHM